MTTFLDSTDARYDDERAGYNLAVEHRPEVIVPATCTDDVVAAVRFAAAHDLPVGVLNTGHGPSRPADGAVLITTARMNGVTIDPLARTARVEAGVRGGDLVRAASEYGLAPLTGSSPEVGVVSYHLGGGIPLLGRRFGWAVDHVIGLDVVTADGVVRRVTVAEEADLFWALRGAGKGSLGVVTAIEIALCPVTRLYGGGMYFTGPAVRDVVHAYAAWTRTVPEDMGSSLLLVRLPDVPGVPEPLRGRFVVHVRFAYLGSADDGHRMVAPFRSHRPVIDTVAEMPYSQVGSIHAEPTTPVAFHSRAVSLATFDEEAADVLLGRATSSPYLVELRHTGGALGRPGSAPSALTRRDGEFVLFAGGAGERAPVVAAVTDLMAAVTPWGTGGICVNFQAGPDVTAEQWGTGFRTEDLDRLAAIKRAVDPTDMFRFHHGRA